MALNENEGIVVQIIGPVIDVEFPHGNLPEIYDKGAALFLAFHINWDDNCHDSAIFRKEFSKLIFTRMIAQTADVELIDFLRELKLEPNVKRFSFVVLQRHEK